MAELDDALEENKKLRTELENLKNEFGRLDTRINGVNNTQSKFTDGLNNSRYSVDAFSASLNMSNTNLLNVGESLKKSLNPSNILDKTAQVEFMTSRLVRESMGASRIASDAFAKTLVDATAEGAKFGIKYEENLNLIKDINDVMQVNTYLSSEQVTNMGVLAKNAGVAGSTIADIAKGFSDIGVGTDDAIGKIGDMQKQARDYGINVGTFMKTVSSNMKLLSTYNFKNGVEGFSKMLAKAQALRIDVSSTFALSEKLLDPEQAIETAAGFQMLGGAIGDLGDPFKLLNMAQTDVAGLQDAMLGMAESAVIFDEETGEFDIPVAEMYRLREAAKLAGKSYEEFTQDAIKAKQRTEKLEILDSFGRYDDKTKELIASLAEFDGGELKVKLPGYDEAINVASLGSEEIAALRDKQAEDNMSDREIARTSMKYLEKMAAAQEEAAISGVKIGVNTKGVTDALEGLEAVANVTSTALSETFSDENIKDFGNSLTEAIASGFDAGGREKMLDAGKTLMSSFNEGVGLGIQQIPDVLGEDNVLRSPELITTFITNLDSLGTSFAELNKNEIFTNLFNTGVNTNYGENDVETISTRDDNTLPHSSTYTSSLDNPIVEETEDFILTSNNRLLKYDKNDLILGVQESQVSSPSLGIGNTNTLNNMSEPSNLGGQMNNTGKLEVKIVDSLKIELNGDKVSELSPRELRKIFGSSEFKEGIAGLLSKNTRYEDISIR